MRVRRPFVPFVVWMGLLAPTVAGAQAPDGVVVAPFVNISGAPEDEWIGVGIAETVETDIGRIAGVEVVRLAASANARGAAALETAREIGAAWLVTGGYQRVGDQIRITASVLDPATGDIADAIRVDGSVGDLFGLQDEVVVQLGAALAGAAGRSPAVAAERSRGAPVERSPAAAGGRSPAAAVPSVQAESVAGNGVGNGAGNGEGRFVPAAERGAPPAPRTADGVILPERPERGRPESAPPGAPARPNGVEGGIAFGEAATASAGFGVAEGAGILTGRPTIGPPRVAEGPRIDGRLDDALWRDALHITDFVQQNPVEGAPATEATDVWIAYDSQNIYVAVHAHYADPGMMRANRVDRDQSFEDDNIAVYFDTFVDQQRAYRFSVNGYGVQGDSVVDSRGFSSRGRGRSGGRGRGRGGGGFFGGGQIPTGDSSWDALFDSGGRIVEDGFTAEMAIPFKSLRYPQRDRGVPHRWGFQVVREVRGKDEFQVWAPVTRNVSGFLTQMGVLEGMTNLSLSRNLEFLPTFTAIRYGRLQGASYNIGDVKPEGGLNVKYGITSNLVADFTYNPDFSQIETDLPQIEVNQRFQLRYPELRPFFLEGAEIFQMIGPITFLYTRHIVDPEIGGRLTGKVGNTTIGVLVANDEWPGRVEAGDPAYRQKANNVAARARYDLYAESYIGTIFTNRTFMGSRSTLGGIDANFRLGRTQSLGMKGVQTDHVDLQGVKRRGQMFDLMWRLNSRNWNAFLGGYTLSPNFRHDLGFVRRVNERRMFSRIGYTFRPESTVVSWGPSLQYSFNYTFDNTLQDKMVRTGFNITFARNIRVNADFVDEMERYRGINFEKQKLSIGTQINTSRRLSFGANYEIGGVVNYNRGSDALPYLGHGSNGNFYATIPPFSRFQSQINLGTSDLIDPSNGDILVFDVKILRALSTYQFTDRFAFRNIAEYNSHDKTLGLNVLFTYRVNAGTAFYIGYDDRYQQGDLIFQDTDGDGITEQYYPYVTSLQRTNRAFFAKFQYLFRY